MINTCKKWKRLLWQSGVVKIVGLLMFVFAFLAFAVAGDEELSKRVDSLVRQLRSGDPSLSRSASFSLQALGEEGRLLLLSRLRAQDALTRQGAVLGLEALADRSSEDALIELVDDPDAGVRSAAIRALGHLDAGGIFRPLLARLDDPAPGVRAAAVGALADLGYRQSTKPIMRMASDPSAEVRGAVAYAIGRLGDRSASALLCLRALLRDEEAKVRRNAAISLGEVGNRLVEEDIVIALADEDPWVRSSSARAAGKLRAGAALAKLRELLEDEKSHVRASAAESLGEIGDGGGLKDLAGLLDDESSSGIFLYTSVRELTVAEVAAISLGRITGDRLGYDPDLPDGRRQKALGRWRKWAEKYRDKG